MKKRAISLLLVLTMAFSILNTVAFAVDPAAAAVVSGGESSVPLAAGGTVEVPVSLTQNPGVAVAYIDVTWDPEALKLTDVKCGDIMPDNGSQSLGQRPDGLGEYTVSLGDFLATKNFEGTGVLFTLVFTILEDAEIKNYEIGLESRDFLSHDRIAVENTVTNGRVELTNAIASHLQWVDDDSELYSDTNLWLLLEPKKEYHTGTKWRYDHRTVYSVTIPVKPDDRIYANSFQSQDYNEGTSDGIAVTFFCDDKVVKALGTQGKDTTYNEFTQNGGYLIVPEGANAVCIPVWKNNENAVVNLLTLPKRLATAELTITEPETGKAPETELSGEGYTGEIIWSPEVNGTFAEGVEYTATVTLTAKEGYKFPADFAATINDEGASFVRNGNGTVAGSVIFAVTEAPRNSHLQWVDDDSELYADTNLWLLLEPKHEYHNGTTWKTAYKKIYSVTIPVKPGDQIYASSFQKKEVTGGTSSGIAVAFFYGEDVVSSLTPAATYAEYTENGYITVPSGVNAVCIPVWENDENAVVNLLTLPARPGSDLGGVSGTVTSYLAADGEVTVELWAAEAVSAAYTTTTTAGTYSITEVRAGTYTMKVSKANHVIREYVVTVSGTAVAQDVKIHPVGDITGDGRINVSDYGKALRHAKKYEYLTGYEFSCGDVTNDGRINVSDYGKLLRHAKKYEYLW